jgi:hypothetical protein
MRGARASKIRQPARNRLGYNPGPHQMMTPHPMFRLRATLSTFVALFLVAAAPLLSSTVSPLTERGYTVLPIPQKVSLGSRDFPLTDGWRLVVERGVQAGDASVRSLQELLKERCGLTLAETGAGRTGVVRLTVAPNTVVIAAATDKDTAVIAEQAYRLILKPEEITVTAMPRPACSMGSRRWCSC